MSELSSGHRAHARGIAFRWRWSSLAPRRRELVFGLAAPLLLIGMLLCGELILRIEQWRAFGANQAFETTVNQQIWEIRGDRRIPRPNARMGNVRFNAQGFRGAAVRMPKPDGVVRVGFFGSSTTLDIYVRDDARTWPAVAMSQVKAAYPGCKLDFFNAAIPGSSVPTALLRLNGEGVRFEPDLAVFLLNDTTNRGREQLTANGVDSNFYKPGWLAEQSILWLKLEKNAVARRLKRVALRKDIAKRLDLQSLQGNLRDDLGALVNAARSRKILPVLVENAPLIRREQDLETQAERGLNLFLFLPHVFIADITALSYLHNDALRETAAAENIPLVRTVAEMPDNPEFYADSSHTTSRGSQVFGTIVGKALSADAAVRAVLNEHGAGCAG